MEGIAKRKPFVNEQSLTQPPLHSFCVLALSNSAQNYMEHFFE